MTIVVVEPSTIHWLVENRRRRRTDIMIFAQPRLDFAGDRFQVRFRRPRADNEEICEGRNLAQIEEHDAFRLFVGRELRAGSR
jgi:hypothetical protein